MKYIATLSGGKDSTAMVDMLLRHGWPLDFIVFKDTLHEFDFVEDYYASIDSLLWYWEYQDADDHWGKWDCRATRAEIEKLSNFHNFAPLYALGFRLSQNLKDEK